MIINGIISRLNITKKINELEEKEYVALFPTEVRKGKRYRTENQRAGVKDVLKKNLQNIRQKNQ